MKHHIVNIILLLLPLLSGYLTSSLCKMDKSAGSSLKSRPPSYIFGIVWPILYLSIGFVWIRTRKYSILIDIFMSILTLLLCLWIIIYSCQNNKKIALYVLLLINMVSLIIYGLLWSNKEVWLAILFTLFLTWINFAIMMNFTEVEKNNILINNN